MSHQRGSAVLLSLLLSASAASGADGPKNLSDRLPLLARHVEPKEFGIQDDTVTTISATSFVPDSDDVGFGVPAFFTSTGLGRYCQPDLDAHYYATLNVPAGAVIDYIGLNTATDTDAIIGLALWGRARNGLKNLILGFSAPAHGWDTDFAGPLDIQVTSNADVEYVLDVEQAPSATYEYFGWVEVHWRRTVSQPPVTGSFDDVPTSHPFFQYIEALKASGITGGCNAAPPLYCPDNPVTRGQMAVFLAKALGLHWPY